jgi:hypothetical protein
MFNNMNVMCSFFDRAAKPKAEPNPSGKELNGKPRPMVVSQRTPDANAFFFNPFL